MYFPHLGRLPASVAVLCKRRDSTPGDKLICLLPSALLLVPSQRDNVCMCVCVLSSHKGSFIVTKENRRDPYRTWPTWHRGNCILVCTVLVDRESLGALSCRCVFWRTQMKLIGHKKNESQQDEQNEFVGMKDGWNKQEDNYLSQPQESQALSDIFN